MSKLVISEPENQIKEFAAAVSRGDADTVKSLLESKIVDINDVFAGVIRPPLYVAAELGDLRMVKLLCEHGAKMEHHLDSSALTPLYVAALNGHYEIVEFFILSKICSIDFRAESNHFTAMYGAVQSIRSKKELLPNKLKIVKFLIDYGASVQGVGTKTTPLHCAISSHYYDCVKILLENGAMIDAQDEYGNTPLHIASTQNVPTQIFKLLVDSGATQNITNKSGKLPLDILHESYNKPLYKISLLKEIEDTEPRKPSKKIRRIVIDDHTDEHDASVSDTKITVAGASSVAVESIDEEYMLLQKLMPSEIDLSKPLSEDVLESLHLDDLGKFTFASSNAERVSAAVAAPGDFRHATSPPETLNPVILATNFSEENLLGNTESNLSKDSVDE